MVEPAGETQPVLSGSPSPGIAISGIGKGEGHKLRRVHAHTTRQWRHVCKGSAHCMNQQPANEPASRRTGEFGSWKRGAGRRHA